MMFDKPIKSTHSKQSFVSYGSAFRIIRLSVSHHTAQRNRRNISHVKNITCHYLLRIKEALNKNIEKIVGHHIDNSLTFRYNNISE